MVDGWIWNGGTWRIWDEDICDGHISHLDIIIMAFTRFAFRLMDHFTALNTRIFDGNTRHRAFGISASVIGRGRMGRAVREVTWKNFATRILLQQYEVSAEGTSFAERHEVAQRIDSAIRNQRNLNSYPFSFGQRSTCVPKLNP